MSGALSKGVGMQPVLRHRAFLITGDWLEACALVVKTLTAFAKLKTPPAASDQWLLKDLTHRAMTPVYSRCHAKMVALAARIVDGRGEDCAQQVWEEYLNALQNPPTDRANFPWPSPPDGGLVRRCRRRACDMLRRNREVSASVLDGPESGDGSPSVIEIPARGPTAEERAADREALKVAPEKRAQLRDCRDELPAAQQSSVTHFLELALDEGFTLTEVAELVGVNYHTFHYRLRKGLSSLRACLEGKGVTFDDLRPDGGSSDA